MIAKLLERVGIPKGEVEGLQLVPKRMPRKIFVWFIEGVDVTQYCRNECYRLATGVKTGTIKPMDSREVEVLIKGLNLNTPDTMVMEYLGLFGKVIKNVVVYVRNKDGPFEGLKNGDRKYKMDFTGGRNLGTYHLVDGANVNISYQGQKRTCARCHQTPSLCLGGGLAKNCDDKGGPKVKLIDFMKELWEEIGFKPAEFTKENENEENDEDIEIRETKGFTPPHKTRPQTEGFKERLSGVSVRNLPVDIETEQAQTFLESYGLPMGHTNLTVNRLKYSTTVDVEGLAAQVCSTIMSNTEGLVAFDRRIQCKGVAGIDNDDTSDETDDANENSEEKENETPAEPTVTSTINVPTNPTTVPQQLLPVHQLLPQLIPPQ